MSHAIAAAADLNAIAEAVRNAGTVAVDIETYGQEKNRGLDPWRGNIRVVTLAAMPFGN